MNDLFRFVGDENAINPDTNQPVGYEHGKVYMLKLVGRGSLMRVLVEAPIMCQYDNWNAFLEDWERI